MAPRSGPLRQSRRRGPWLVTRPGRRRWPRESSSCRPRPRRIRSRPLQSPRASRARTAGRTPRAGGGRSRWAPAAIGGAALGTFAGVRKQGSGPGKSRVYRSGRARGSRHRSHHQSPASRGGVGGYRRPHPGLRPTVRSRSAGSAAARVGANGDGLRIHEAAAGAICRGTLEGSVRWIPAAPWLGVAPAVRASRRPCPLRRTQALFPRLPRGPPSRHDSQLS